MTLLRATALSIAVDGRELARIADMSLERGQVWAVLGPNGAGKTTLLHTLAGLRPSPPGAITLNDVSLSHVPAGERAKHIALLLQDTDAVFPGTVLELALSGRYPHARDRWYDTADDIAIALTALHTVGVAALAQRDVHTLSGGERRRAAIAALLAQHAPLMLLDEAGNHLDIKHHVDVLTAVRKHVTERNGAAMLSMHDVNVALQFCDHALLLFGDGEVAMGVCRDILTEQTLSRLYGHGMTRLTHADYTAFLPTTP